MSSRIKSRATSVFTTSVFTTSIFTTSDLSLVAGEFADQVQGFVRVPPTRKKPHLELGLWLSLGLSLGLRLGLSLGLSTRAFWIWFRV